MSDNNKNIQIRLYLIILYNKISLEKIPQKEILQIINYLNEYKILNNIILFLKNNNNCFFLFHICKLLYIYLIYIYIPILLTFINVNKEKRKKKGKPPDIK